MRLFRGIVCVTVLLATTFCAYSEEPLDSQGELNLKILHINDHHSHLAPNMGANLKLLGEDTKVEMGGFPRLTTKFRELSADHPHTLKLHAGDAITGTPFYALLEGEADAKLMNEICFDAFALGNHEFDLGEAALQNFLDHLTAGACHTPALAANVVPEVGTPLAPSGVNDYIKPYIIKELGIEEDGINEDGINEDVKHKVGIIGIDIVTKTVTSSNPSDTTRFLDEVACSTEDIIVEGDFYMKGESLPVRNLLRN